MWLTLGVLAALALTAAGLAFTAAVCAATAVLVTVTYGVLAPALDHARRDDE